MIQQKHGVSPEGNHIVFFRAPVAWITAFETKSRSKTQILNGPPRMRNQKQGSFIETKSKPLNTTVGGSDSKKADHALILRPTLKRFGDDLLK